MIKMLRIFNDIKYIQILRGKNVKMFRILNNIKYIKISRENGRVVQYLAHISRQTDLFTDRWNL